MKFRVFLVLVFAAGISSAALAQVREGTVEISPFAGYLFGGEFSRGSTDLFDFRVEADDDATYGIRLGFNLQYDWPAPIEAGKEIPAGSVTRTGVHDSLALILESGKSIVAAQSADPIGDRQVTVEVKATVLR